MMIKKVIWVFALISLLVSCKAKKAVAESAAEEDLAASKVIQQHYALPSDFKTINIRANAKYRDDKQSQSVSADIRIKKDQVIWVNVKFIGIPMAKALITPTEVQYFEKINGTYFKGDFQLLSNWLGTDLDFKKLQNLFLGKAIDDLTKAKYIAQIQDNLYKLSEKKQEDIEKEFYFEAANFLVKKETILQKSKNRALTVEYPSHSKTGSLFLPNEIAIAAQQDEVINIDLTYKNVTFDEDLNFPFSIPNGYERVTINN
ncbi:DUF4292 domain-containing protein [Flavobacterium sp. NRK F10]|uniref:DUF4292 domain-containing protein n=1 Tax=Flavobacterium sp. NRK F10 TaxID=2954931 RepID=UPI002090DE6B|nr:DUF4292 domain-containing protein [Flavobacterium sp. NRK F10]